MATSNDNFFIQIIKGLTTTDFFEVIKLVELKYFNAEAVVDIDGTNDGGNDVRIFQGKSPLKRCVQLTVQKNISVKIHSDLKKFDTNIRSHHYSDTADYFWSQEISEKQRKEYVKMALDNYGIHLNFYDAKDIVGLDIQEVKSFLYSLVPKPQIDKIDKIGRESKVMYDLLAMGNDTSDIKNNLINSLIVFYVYEKGHARIADICNHIKAQVGTIKSDELIRNQVNNLRSDKRLISQDNKQVVSLSETEQTIIDDAVKQSDIIQVKFKEGLEAILKKYDQVDKFDAFFSHLECLYKSYYQLDIDETDKRIDYSDGANKVFAEFQNWISKNVSGKMMAANLITEIKQLCTDNEYINKICVTSSFISLYKSNKLESYLCQSNKNIFLDTPILVFALCKYYSDDSVGWDDPFFKATSGLLDACETMKGVVLYVSHDYINEVAGELQKALRLAFFLELDFYTDLGEIKNSFINFYLFMREKDLLDASIVDFFDFVTDLGFDNTDPDSSMFTSDTVAKIREYVNAWDIEITKSQYYPDFETLKKEYEVNLMKLGKTKSPSAINHDIKTIINISARPDDDETHPENFLSSWDISFYDFRKLLINKHGDKYQFFHIYNPARLLNKIGLENFNANSTIITNDIFAYADATYNISSKVRSLIEMIAPIFGHKNSKNISLLNEISKIRKTQIEGQSSEDLVSRKSTPIEDVFINIIKYYKSPENSDNLDKLATFFSDESRNNAIITIFKSSFADYKNDEETSKRIIKSFDELMSKEGLI